MLPVGLTCSEHSKSPVTFDRGSSLLGVLNAEVGGGGTWENSSVQWNFCAYLVQANIIAPGRPLHQSSFYTKPPRLNGWRTAKYVRHVSRRMLLMRGRVAFMHRCGNRRSWNDLSVPSVLFPLPISQFNESSTWAPYLQSISSFPSSIRFLTW